MTITLSFVNVLLAILTAAIVIAAFYLVTTLKKLSSFLASLEPVVKESKEILKKSSNVLDRAERVLEETEETVREAKHASARIRGVVEETSNLIEDAIFIFKPVSIISQAFKNGLALARKFFSKDENSEEESE